MQPLYAYFAEFKFKFLKLKEDIVALFQGERQAFIAAIFTHTRFKKIWGEPDFDALFQSYHCERSRVVAALEYLQQKNCITLEAKRITEVFSVNFDLLCKGNLSATLHDYFIDKEQKEIKRITALVRFFELSGCLNQHLSLYFDDVHAPENCGHCSVCRGEVAKLEYSTQPHWPSDQQISKTLEELSGYMAAESAHVLAIIQTTDNFSRFLAGISVPV